MSRIPRYIMLLAALLGVAVCSTIGSAAMVSGMNPYLAAVTANSVYVLVECDSTSTVTVQYGLTASYGSTATTETTEASSATPATYVHNVKLTGLQANTTYHYRAYQVAGTYSADSTFTTACNPGTSFRFAWAADCRSNATIWNTTSGIIDSYNPRFLLFGGDTCASSSVASFKSEFFVANTKALLAHCPFVNAVGNHETFGTATKAYTQAPASSSGRQDYYSFDYGDMHVICLNTIDSSGVPWTVGSAQYNWVQSDLQSTNKTWKIVMTHWGAYSGGIPRRECQPDHHVQQPLRARGGGLRLRRARPRLRAQLRGRHLSHAHGYRGYSQTPGLTPPNHTRSSS